MKFRHFPVEETGSEYFILDEDESDDELIDVEEIWKDTLLSNIFIFCILTFTSCNYFEEIFYK